MADKPAKRQADWLGAAVHGIMAALFAGGAYVQLNDPDPHVWATAYSLASLAALYSSAVSMAVVPLIPLEYSMPVVALFFSFPFSLLTRTAKPMLVALWDALSSPAALRGDVSAWRTFIEVEETREAAGMILLLAYIMGVAASHVIEPAPPRVAAAGDALKDNKTAAASAGGSTAAPGGSSGLLSALASPAARTNTYALAFLGVYAALWAGWALALRTNSVSVGEHCQGML